jgi:hypothetical protein
MKAVARSKMLIALALSLTTCDVWGGRDNPSDPGARNYQGYASVASIDEFALCYPANGGMQSGPKVVVTKVVGATAYQSRFAASQDVLANSALIDSVCCKIYISNLDI